MIIAKRVAILQAAVVAVGLGASSSSAQDGEYTAISIEFGRCAQAVSVTVNGASEEVQNCTEQALSSCLDTDDPWQCFHSLTNEVQEFNGYLVSTLMQSDATLGRKIAVAQYELSKLQSRCVDSTEFNVVSQCLLVAEMAHTSHIIGLVE